MGNQLRKNAGHSEMPAKMLAEPLEIDMELIDRIEKGEVQPDP